MKAYITVLTNDLYLPGVKALKRSLLNVKSKYKLAILIKSDDLELKNKLLDCGIIDDYCFLAFAQDIELVDSLTKKLPYHRWNDTFFKLRVCELVQFEKIVLLDSDMLITKNIDSLFDKPSYSAVQADKICKNSYLALNSGLMVLEPNKKLFEDLLNLIETTFDKKIATGEYCGDQDVFREYDRDWENKKELILPITFNVYFSYLSNLKKNFKCKNSDINVIHFIGKIKPWELKHKQLFKSKLKMFLHCEFYKINVLNKYLRYCK